MTLQLRTPNGTRILGTLERLTARADIFGWTRDADGTLSPDYDGHTEVFWNGQMTETDEHRNFILLDENGDEWTVADCTPYDDEEEPE